MIFHGKKYKQTSLLLDTVEVTMYSTIGECLDKLTFI